MVESPKLVTDVMPEYKGIAGLDTRISKIDERFPELAKHIGEGMCLHLGRNRSILSQRNGNQEVRTYAWLRLDEAEAENPFECVEPQEILKRHIEKYYEGDAWDDLSKSIILNADIDTVIWRKVWQLPVGLQWQTRRG